MVKETAREENETLHRELLQRITRVETLITSGFNDVAGEVSGLKNQVTIANGRTRKLEDWKITIEAKAGVIAVLVSFLTSVLFLLFNKYL